MSIKEKLTSRKFWLSFASFLGSVSAAIAGIYSDNEVIAVIGIVCATASSAIYSVCESIVDKQAIDITDAYTIVEEDALEEEAG